MSEIEKMYENAGIGKRMTCFFECSRKTCSVDCEHFEKLDMSYPPFTAEKQLEITKFLLKKAVYYDVKDDKYWFYLDECESDGYKPFDEAIAHFINKLWKDLKPEEKQQIKEILG